MKKADIKTGFLCNNNCLFCVQGDDKKSFGNKKGLEIKKIIMEASRDCEIIVFTGGEPTIRKDLIDLVKYAKQMGFKTIQIQSNGRMFAYKKFCKDIVEAGANEFALAIHGHIPELHNYLTQSESFLQAVNGIKNLKQLNQRVIMNTVITKSNYRHLPEIAKLFIGLGIDQFQFAFVHALGAASENFKQVVPRIKLVTPYVIKALKIGKHFNVPAMTEAIPPCFLRGYENNVSENIMPHMKIFDLKEVVADFREARIAEGKAKGPQCKKCSLNVSCEGPWKEYPEHFGWEEFDPVK